MVEREVFHANHPNSVIGHVIKKVTLEGKFAMELYILFTRLTINNGISKSKIGIVNNKNTAIKVKSFLDHLHGILKDKELYDVLIEGRGQLPDNYPEYEITGGTLKGYEIAGKRLEIFKEVIRNVKNRYNEKRSHIPLELEISDLATRESLSPSNPIIALPEPLDESPKNLDERKEMLRGSVGDFLASLPAMQFCNNKDNPKPYTVFSHDKDTVIIDPKFVNSSEEKPSIIYRRPIYYKTNATDTDRKEFSRGDLFQGLATKEKRIKFGNINANGNAQREVIFSKSFFKEGITSEREISNILEKLSKMDKEMQKKSAVIRDIEKNKKPEEGRIARSLIGSIQKVSQNKKAIPDILLELLTIDDDRSLRVADTKIHEKNRDDIASFLGKIIPLLGGRRAITCNDLTTILSEDQPNQDRNKIKKMVDAINELWRKFDAYNEEKERAKKLKNIKIVTEGGLGENERRRIERGRVKKEEVEEFATKVKEFLQRLGNLEFSHSKTGYQEYTILTLTDGKVMIGRKFIDGDEASGTITDEPFTNEIFYREKDGTKWERRSFTELFQPLITLEAEGLKNKDIKSHFGLRKIFDEGFSENGITAARKLDAILKAWCKIANIEYALST